MLKKTYSFLLALLMFAITAQAQSPWIQKTNFGGAPRGWTSEFTIGHYAFVGNGVGTLRYNDFWKYNANTDTWTAIASYPGQGVYCNTAFSIEGKGYVGFGANASNVGTDDLWEYDTISNTWTQMATFPGLYRYSNPAFVIGHKAYMVGGCHIGPPYMNDVWVYDAHQNTWTQLNNFPGGDIESYICFAIGNHGYIGNGYWNPGCYQQNYEYDTASDTWTPFANIPVSYGITENPDSWVIGSKAYLATGSQCTSNGLRYGWVYDTVTKSWCEFADIATAKLSRGDGVTFTLNNNRYFSTGLDTNLHYLGDLWEYTPSLNFGLMNNTVCYGDSIHFRDSSSYLVTSWTWSFPGGSPSTSTLQNPAVSYPGSGPYTVTLTINTCDTIESFTKQFNITLNTPPILNITGNLANCAGIPDTLAASGGGTYSWSNGATTSSIIISPPTTTIYTLAVSNGCTKDTSMTIQVIPLPSITFSANNPICKGDSSIITATGGGSYLWNTGATTSTITVTPSATTTYSVIVTNISGSCQKDSSIKITVNPIPTISLSGRDSVCSGNSTTLSASGGTNYLWSTGATTSSITNVIISNITYTVQVSSGGCSKDTAIHVIANPLPSVSLSGNNILCAGDSTTLSASGGTIYNWSTGATTSAITVKPGSTTTYTLAVNNGTCAKDTNIKVTVNPLPAITISGVSAICLGDSSTLTASGGGTYLWSNSSTSGSITVKPVSNTTYTVTVTNNNCSKDTTINILVNTLSIGISGPVSICYGDTATLTSSGGATYSWSTGSTMSSISVTPNATTTYTATITKGACVKDTTITVTVNPSPFASIIGKSQGCKGDSVIISALPRGTFLWSTGQTTDSIYVDPSTSTVYTLTVTNSFGCKKDTTFKVSVVSANGAISGPSSVCSGDSIQLTASGGGTYSWSTGATKNSIYVHPSANTTYSVIVNNGCIDTVTKSVSIFNPVLFACCDTTILIPGTSVILQASGTSSYLWAPSAGLSCDSCPDPTVNPTVTTTYTVIGTDSAGCKLERTITVDVSTCLNTSSIPNVFTPNGDTKNDVFFIDAQSVSDYSITIYDRWGKTMYSSTNPLSYWEGRNQNDNSLVSDGVYYYILKYTCSGKPYNKDGFVQVIR